MESVVKADFDSKGWDWAGRRLGRLWDLKADLEADL